MTFSPKISIAQPNLQGTKKLASPVIFEGAWPSPRPLPLLLDFKASMENGETVVPTPAPALLPSNSRKAPNDRDGIGAVGEGLAEDLLRDADAVPWRRVNTPDPELREGEGGGEGDRNDGGGVGGMGCLTGIF